MSLADWQEKLISKARAFVKAESDANLRELKVAAYGYGHWVAELEKAKKREQRFVPEGK